jgi:malonate transporter
MTKVLADALAPIFTGLLLGYWAGRRGLMDSVNIRNLIVFVMNFAAPCALFSIIIGTSREVLREQLMTVFAIALVFTGIYLECYFWARYRVGMSIPDGAVLALTFGFPNSAAMAVSLLSSTFGPKASVPAALSIVVGSMTIVPITLDLLELGSKTVEPEITARTLLRGILRSFARPVVWAPIIALLFACLHVHFPTYAIGALNTLGSAINGSALVLTGLVISAHPFRMNVKARAIRSAAGIATDLADNIAHGVRWHDATSAAQELGCQLFLEMPPGHALSDLVRENLSEVEAYPVVSGSIDRLFKRAQS